MTVRGRKSGQPRAISIAIIERERPRFPASPQPHRQLLGEYFRAVQTGELATLVGLRAEDATLWADGGGRARTSVLHPIRGRDAVARVSLSTKRSWPEHFRGEIGEVNGQPALIMRAAEQTWSVVTIDVTDGRIQAIRVIVNPDKLTRI